MQFSDTEIKQRSNKLLGISFPIRLFRILVLLLIIFQQFQGLHWIENLLSHNNLVFIQESC
jgi:hypothetical protein